MKKPALGAEPGAFRRKTRTGSRSICTGELAEIKEWEVLSGKTQASLFPV